MHRSIHSNWFLSLVAFAFVAASLTLTMHGRTLSSTPAAAASAVQQGQPTPATSGVATIYARSNLVVVDVVVTDSKKNPVHGLQKSDFVLMENGKPQVVRNFEEHTELPASETMVAPAPKLPPDLFTNKSSAPANGPANVLVLDYLNTPQTAHASARKQLLDYLDKAPAGTRIAIFILTERLTMLQGFTSDPAVLKAALTSMEGLPRSSNLIDDAEGVGSPDGPSFAESLGGAGGDTDSGGVADVIRAIHDAMTRVDAQISSEKKDMQVKYTLSAFDQLARYLVGIPGRKNVVWFSAGFPLDVEPNRNEADPNDSVIRNDDEVRKTDNLLTRAQIAVYPVDVRGMSVPWMDLQKTAAAAASAATASQTGLDPSAANDAIYDASVMPIMQQTAQEHGTMDAMAEDTGGEAFYNTNGLTQAISKAIEHGSNYYTLTYTPSNLQWDERFRSLKIKVAEPGVQLTYRNGYYAIDPNDRNKVNAAGAATALAQADTMSTAMMHGGPDPTEILFKVRIRPSSKPAEAVVLTSNRTNPDPKVKVSGPYKQYGVDLVPDPRAVNCRAGADGKYHCALEIWTYVYDRDGRLLITTGNPVYHVLTPADYARLLSGGMAFHQQVSVPAKGQYYLRTAIHDLVSDRVGAVEVPVAAVARLDPLKEIAAVPAPAPHATGKPTTPRPAPTP
jgi:VWFA-related protein